MEQKTEEFMLLSILKNNRNKENFGINKNLSKKLI